MATSEVLYYDQTDEFKAKVEGPMYTGPSDTEVTVDPTNEWFMPKDAGDMDEAPAQKERRPDLSLAIDLDEWDPTDRFTAYHKPFVALFGKRFSGKSHAMMWLMRYVAEYYERAIVICPTEGLNRQFNGYIPDPFIFRHYSNDIPKALFVQQEEIARDPVMLARATADPDHDPRNTLMILDDARATLQHRVLGDDTVPDVAGAGGARELRLGVHMVQRQRDVA